MKILLIDDDDNKVAEISKFISEARASDELTVRRSFQSGLREIILYRADLVILDMTMPTYDVGVREAGGRERRYAGKEVLRQMSRRGITTPTIIITQYEHFEEDGKEVTLEELVKSLSAEFPDVYKGTVYYQASGNDWTVDLGRLIKLFSTN